MKNINTNLTQSYQTLHDISRTGKEIQWNDKKLKTHNIAKSYYRIGNINKAIKLRECGTFLEFKRFSDNSLKLNNANFCKVRLCPLCSWRRSLKIFGQVSQIMNEVTKNNEYQFLFLTLTIKNCKGIELSDALNMMLKGYNYIFMRSKVKKSILGAFRALEITHNTNKYSKSYDTYHPHFHCILVVNKSYFNSRKDKYISQEEWTQMWQESIKSEYKPMVHIEKINDDQKNIEKAVAETAKYSVKDSDLFSADKSLQDSAIYFLDNALINRRLISYRGIFRKVHQQLKLDDVIEGDLINCDSNEELRKDIDYILERYSWNIGYNQYCKLNDNNNEFASV